MQKVKTSTYHAVKWATIIGAGTAFGTFAGYFAYVFGTLSSGDTVGYMAGAAGVLLASTASTALASLPFQPAKLRA